MRNSKRKIGSGNAGRFDQKNVGFSRALWDPLMQKPGEKIWKTPHVLREDSPGNTLLDWSFAQATSELERRYGQGNYGGNFGLTQWDISWEEIQKRNRLAPGQRYVVSDPVKMTRDVKRVARFLGASLVGICKVDMRWVYSHRYHFITREHSPIEIPEEFKYAIVMAHEMDYEVLKASPAYLSLASTGKGYSDMVYVLGLLAHFIRGLGYKAIPCGNDTALSVPMAIDAGLGELGRHGIMMTKEFGPRIRLSKLFTNLPLLPDEPVEIGVRRFCEVCKRCADHCPGMAISHDDPTDRGPNISSAHGIYKWYVDAEKCFGFWGKNGAGCNNCIRVCPYNKPKGILHTTVKFLIKNFPWLNRGMLWGDKVFGYGEREVEGVFWN